MVPLSELRPYQVLIALAAFTLIVVIGGYFGFRFEPFWKKNQRHHTKILILISSLLIVWYIMGNVLVSIFPLEHVNGLEKAIFEAIRLILTSPLVYAIGFILGFFLKKYYEKY